MNDITFDTTISYENFAKLADIIPSEYHETNEFVKTYLTHRSFLHWKKITPAIQSLDPDSKDVLHYWKLNAAAVEYARTHDFRDTLNESLDVARKICYLNKAGKDDPDIGAFLNRKFEIRMLEDGSNASACYKDAADLIDIYESLRSEYVNAKKLESETSETEQTDVA